MVFAGVYTDVDENVASYVRIHDTTWEPDGAFGRLMLQTSMNGIPHPEYSRLLWSFFMPIGFCLEASREMNASLVKPIVTRGHSKAVERIILFEGRYAQGLAEARILRGGYTDPKKIVDIAGKIIVPKHDLATKAAAADPIRFHSWMRGWTDTWLRSQPARISVYTASNRVSLKPGSVNVSTHQTRAPPSPSATTCF
jgi:hypothetical protein